MMRILVCGARGFIGHAISERLAGAGHTVLRGVREPAGGGEVAIDFTRQLTVEDWIPFLADVDVVINAVGILVERSRQTFADVHRNAPCALFEACARAGVQRVVQISALGAERGTTGYFTSKRAADDFLMAQPLEWQVVRPALVYGAEGGSARFFRMLASLPLTFLPGDGRQRLQPIHIDDLAEAVLRLSSPATPPHQCIELVGGEAVEYGDMLARYRAGMAFPPPLQLPGPAGAMRLMAAMAGWMPGAILTPDTWAMLQAGNTGDATATRALLGRPPRAIGRFIPADEADITRQQALAAWRTPLLRSVLALVWLLTAVVSLFVHPVAESLELLAAVGLTGSMAMAALYGAALLDAGMGIATLLAPGRRLWRLQLGIVVTYSAIIAIALPEYLAHPFGPITKNLPIVAILLLLHAEETRP
jgi:uncharacterized protein YbjT (DUF2867 family)